MKDIEKALQQLETLAQKWQSEPAGVTRVAPTSAHSISR